ncbi:MAG: nicotinate-nucleotide adenylyltransferase [Dehalococcoidales bacterium]|nr:nicotinate-nucleotide adenylyltransferase [Dehalococcoidales bacterium]
MNIGVLGGTFDPIHIGHLKVAEEAVARLDLPRILFMPAGQPWLKASNVNAISPVQHRLEMVRLGIAGNPRFKLSTLEIERSGPTYTVDTIAQLQSQLGAGDEIFFILGWDNLSQLPRWHKPERLIKMCRLVAVPRVDFPLPDLPALEKELPGIAERVILFDKPRIDINASEIRRRAARGLSISDFVPEPVERYIKEHGLYAKEKA